MPRPGYTEVTVPAGQDAMMTFDVLTDTLLPEGKKCGDCLWFERCRWLISCRPTNTYCDWSPSRFRPRAS